jgi:ATP-dependent Clp protease, protease subunit
MYKIENIKQTLHIYISGVIDDETCNKMSNDIINAKSAGSSELMMHINSYGGSVAGAYQLISTIHNTGMNFIAQNEGFAISAAGILLASANDARCYDYSIALVHDPLIGGQTLNETKGKDKEFLTKVKDGLMSILNKRFKMDIEDLKVMMSKETTMNADEQKLIGLVDSIITTSNKPQIDDTMEVMEVYNIFESFKNNNKKEEENIMEIKKEDETVAVVENAVVVETVENIDFKEVIAKLEAENKLLKVDNFILVNKLEEKKDKIEDAVKLHGVEVLNTLLSFMSVSDVKVVEELKETKEKLEVVENKVTEIVNSANDVLGNICSGNKDKSIDKAKEAEEYFGINVADTKRIELQHEDPIKYNELYNIFWGMEE